MKKTTMLHKLLKEPGLLIVPAAYDCLSARCVEAVGFKAVFMSGSGIRGCQLGLPDIGLATATEVINVARYMANSVNIPLIVDVDDGFGAMPSAYRTTQEMIRAGVAGILVNDQKPFTQTTTPHSRVGVLPRDEYLSKMKAVLEARNKEDKDFIIAVILHDVVNLGDEELLARAKTCLELGVDVILPQFRLSGSKYGARDKKNLKKLYRVIGSPRVPIWSIGPNEFTAKDYEDIEAKIWVTVKNPIITAVANAALSVYQRLYDTGQLPMAVPPEGPSSDNLQKLTGLNFWGETKLTGLDFWGGLEKRNV